MTHILEKAPYSKYLLECNNRFVDGFREWVFHSGMLFASCEKWWGKGGVRDRPHEGLDMVLWRDDRGLTQRVEAGVVVPALYAGEVVMVEQDYLGDSLYVRHAIDDGGGRTLHTVYGHIRVGSTIGRAGKVTAGEAVGSVADPRHRGRQTPAHLHLTAAWIPDRLAADELNWDSIGALGLEALIDPLEVIACPTTVEDVPFEM